MSKTIFSRFELEAFRRGITPRTKESREWFRKKASKLTRPNPKELMKSKELRRGRKHVVGSMQMFFYDPKHKDTLPYYDIFPLAIIISPKKNGFLGLNLHYLPPILRAKFFEEIMKIQNSNLTENSRLVLTYRMLKTFSTLKYYKPCIKHYLSKHVASDFAEVKMPEWEIATFLPTAQFRKKHIQKVYSDSRKIIARN